MVRLLVPESNALGGHCIWVASGCWESCLDAVHHVATLVQQLLLMNYSRTSTIMCIELDMGMAQFTNFCSRQ